MLLCRWIATEANEDYQMVSKHHLNLKQGAVTSTAQLSPTAITNCLWLCHPSQCQWHCKVQVGPTITQHMLCFLNSVAVLVAALMGTSGAYNILRCPT